MSSRCIRRITGGQTARKLRQLGYDCPIIALTADAMQGDLNKCLDAGCNDYLSKLIDKSTMSEMVSSLISNSQNEFWTDRFTDLYTSQRDV